MLSTSSVSNLNRPAPMPVPAMASQLPSEITGTRQPGYSSETSVRGIFRQMKSFVGSTASAFSMMLSTDLSGVPTAGSFMRFRVQAASAASIAEPSGKVNAHTVVSALGAQSVAGQSARQQSLPGT